MLLISLSFAMTTSAQKIYGRVYAPRPVIVHSYYPAYGWGVGWYYGYPYYTPYYANPIVQPSKLDNEIASIHHDYDQKIASVKMDKSLSRKERKAAIKDLKKQRDDQIDDAKRDYYKHS